MMRTYIVFLIFLKPVLSPAQYNENTAAVLLKLDSLRKENSVSRHFASIYFEATANALSYFSKKDMRTQELIARCEASFASFFFRAADAYHRKEKPPAEWQLYFRDSAASSLRLILYGINAHINGDIWQSLVAEFSEDEITELKPAYMEFYEELVKLYRKLYETAYDTSRKARFIHHASLGIAKPYGKWMLLRWRKRQVRLAELYFSDRAVFERKLQKNRRKMDSLNKFIRRNI